MTVDRLPIDSSLKQALASLKITSLFDIQRDVFHPILQGMNVVGRSRTGTGKTLAYLVPVLQRMKMEKLHASDAAVLILLPTRELAKQVGMVLLGLSSSFLHLNIALLYGGAPVAPQAQLLKLQPNVVIGTPGRCQLMVDKGLLSLSSTKVVIIDEADALMAHGFAAQVQTLLQGVGQNNAKFQSLLFTASFTPELRALIDKHFDTPTSAAETGTNTGGDGKCRTVVIDTVEGTRVGVDDKGKASETVTVPTTVQQVRHYVLKVPTLASPHSPTPTDPSSPLDLTATSTLTSHRNVERRLRVLIQLLTDKLRLKPYRGSLAKDGSRGRGKAIVFAGMKEVEMVVRHPALEGHARALHSKLDQTQRDFILNGFAENKYRVLVCTDLVARGLDYPDVTHVVHFRPPAEPNNYIHRAGRTGRAGKGGESIMMYSSDEYPLVKAIHTLTRQQFTPLPTPDPKDLERTHTQQLMNALHDIISSTDDGTLNDSELDYRPYLPAAERLIKTHGAAPLANALALLDGGSVPLASGLPAPLRVSPLSGRRGFMPLALIDTNHTVLTNADRVRAVLQERMPVLKQKKAALGRIVKTANGYVFDVKYVYGAKLLHDSEERAALEQLGVQLTHVSQLPRLLVDESEKAKMRKNKKLPWRRRKGDRQHRLIVMGLSARQASSAGLHPSRRITHRQRRAPKGTFEARKTDRGEAAAWRMAMGEMMRAGGG
ncbi:unnamed protein product [Vitrella brassicaformis CCMP3155]|uniref:RNA helicase n=1 Tax=Vitrella brassicaformis (strain CCMP3155) TaxID=1169540 RepID=A0A0G4GIW2_VITBC|nr:unnamed protein product [Vitrella brassicaformis CCMP3155]|eukprot:CEM29687.1 unnamed protein product [Vitrella brassicaformis CCMP3155]